MTRPPHCTTGSGRGARTKRLVYNVVNAKSSITPSETSSFFLYRLDSLPVFRVNFLHSLSLYLDSIFILYNIIRALHPPVAASLISLGFSSRHAFLINEPHKFEREKLQNPSWTANFRVSLKILRQTIIHNIRCISVANPSVNNTRPFHGRASPPIVTAILRILRVCLQPVRVFDSW